MFLSTLLSVSMSLVASANQDYPNPCPQVSGTYRSCVGGQAEAIEVTKQNQNGFVNITITQKAKNREDQVISFLVDGTSHPIVVDGAAAIGFIAYMTNQCANEVLNSKLYILDKPLENSVKLYAELNISAPAAGKLKIETKDSSGRTTVMTCKK